MIRSFTGRETEGIWNGSRSRKLPPEIQQTARRKLRAINRARKPHDLAIPRGNRLEELKGDRKGTYSIASTTSGGSPSAGVTETRTMSASRTIIPDEERLENVHPGDILREDFLIGSEISTDEVSRGTGISIEKLQALLDGRASVTAETDLRLGRYFGISEGFFLGLQDDYDLEEVRRSKAGKEIDRIVPRAA